MKEKVFINARIIDPSQNMDQKVKLKSKLHERLCVTPLHPHAFVRSDHRGRHQHPGRSQHMPWHPG